ncbi:restriction endonuclease [Acinetobacter sp.]|uniref:restriction endonuclease n=1 Tax=Acinetobacter sp. TaxID=472 RepID=UPI003890E0E5
MSNLQAFQNALASNFPIEIADQVLGRMQQLYGAEFDKKFAAIDPEQLQQTTCLVLNGITPQQLERGLNRMLSEKWCPSLPELRNMCLASDWWTAEQAWAKALQFEAASSENGVLKLLEQRYFENLRVIQNSNRTEQQKSEMIARLDAKYKADLLDARKPITKLTKKALDEVRHILDNEGQKAAHRAFKDIYEDYLRKATEKGYQQEMWVAPKPVKQLGYSDAPRNGVPCPPELAAKLGKVGKRLGGVA